MTQQTRKDPRAKVLSMTVRYKSATLDEFIEHHSHDVSRGGMFIKTPQAFPPGTLLKFEVRIAEDRKVMQGVGRVVWKRDVAAADAERPAGMGVKFIKLDDDSRRLIDQLLSSRRDESSAFDEAEAAQGVEAEAPIGLGTEPLSVPPVEPSFFPKLAPAELPAPEDRTVMKQAAELLQEALREVGDNSAKSTAKVAPPSGDDDKEDTKPGRPSKPSDSGLKVQAPRVAPPNPRATAHGAPSATPLASKAAPPRNSTPSPAHPDAADMASVAQEITDKARLVSAAKPAPVPSRKPAARTGKEPLAARSLPATKPVPPKPTGAQPALAGASRSSGTNRAVFWFLAVAACAAGTWFLWRPTANQPAAPEPPKDEQLQAQSPPSPPAEPAPPPSAVVPEPAAPEAAAASVEAPSPSIAQPAAAAAPPEPAPAQPEAAPAIVKPAVAPKVARRKSTATEASGSEAPPVEATPIPPEATPEPKQETPPASEPKPAETKPAEPKPAAPAPAPPPAPAEPPAPKAAPVEPPPAAPAEPPAKKKGSAPAPATDNPY
ncbi:MAG TPA: TIGR02266 family protein [Polyangiaceae bacterium]